MYLPAASLLKAGFLVSHVTRLTPPLVLLVPVVDWDDDDGHKMCLYLLFEEFRLSSVPDASCLSVYLALVFPLVSLSLSLSLAA